MLKRVDVAAYQTLKDAMDGTFTAGVVSLGLAEDGIDWAQDEHNAALVSDAVRAAVEKAKAEIISGAISVHDYESDSSCPF
jgi:basic membrane protein A